MKKHPTITTIIMERWHGQKDEWTKLFSLLDLIHCIPCQTEYRGDYGCMSHLLDGQQIAERIQALRNEARELHDEAVSLPEEDS